MKNSKYFLIILGFVLIIGIAFFFFSKNNTNSNISKNDENNTEISRTSTDTNIEKNTSENNSTTNNINDNVEQRKPEIKEENISEFSTKIYSKDSSRQTNLQITSSTLNGTIVEPGKTFSFTETVGKASPENGYQKADIYDENGNKTKGYGGGNCQISSTLYNAVLQLPSLSVTERHPHSKKVPYVKKGKDAAVAYGSVDFKFVNNYDYSIKIYCSVDKKNVYVRIVKIV